MRIHQDPEANNNETNNNEEEQVSQPPKTNNDDHSDGTQLPKTSTQLSRRRGSVEIIVEYSKSSFKQIRDHISRVALMSILCSIITVIQIYNGNYF